MHHNNAKFLAEIDSDTKSQILGSIAKQYGISVESAYEEVTAESAEHLLDYLVEPQRTAVGVLMRAANSPSSGEEQVPHALATGTSALRVVDR